MNEQIWIRVLCPVSVSTLAEITAVAPKKTFIREGGVAYLGREEVKVLEFVVVEQTKLEEVQP